MTKPKSKKTPAAKKPKTEEKKKSGKVTQIDELELKKIVGGKMMGYSDPANN